MTGKIVICNTRPEHAQQLEELQCTVFPTMEDAHRFKAPQYLKHIELFPEGQFVALDGSRVVGMTSTVRYPFDFNHCDHRFNEISQDGWLTSHDPNGDWMYGCDVGTHPDYRGKGIARALYAARHDTVRALKLRGQVAVGMLSGYGKLKDVMSAEQYYDELTRGVRFDPTVSVQEKVGFRLAGLIPDYLDDPVCANYGVLLVLEAERDVRSSPSGGRDDERTLSTTD